MNLEIIKNVQQCFETKFGTTALTVFSPGRINLIGEHTDYNDGFVFPAAINLGIVVAIQKTNSNSTQVILLHTEASENDYMAIITRWVYAY